MVGKCMLKCSVASVMFDSWQPHGLNPPGSSVHGIFQARTLEWVAMPSSGDLPKSEIKPTFLNYTYLKHAIWYVCTYKTSFCQDKEYIHHFQKFSIPYLNFCFLTSLVPMLSPEKTDLPVYRCLHFLEYYRSEIIPYFYFVWILLLRITMLTFYPCYNVCLSCMPFSCQIIFHYVALPWFFYALALMAMKPALPGVQDGFSCELIPIC